MSATLLALTLLDADSHAHLNRVAALAQANGLRLRLAYGGSSHKVFHSPLARLQQRARHLARRFDLVVDAVEEAMTSLDVLRFHAGQSTLLCLPPIPTAPGSGTANIRWLKRALRMHSVPLLVMRDQKTESYTRVLVPVSLRADSEHLLRCAQALTAQARIDLLHVTDLPEVACRPDDEIGPIVAEHFLRKTYVEVHQRMVQLCSATADCHRDWHFAMGAGPVLEGIMAHQSRHGYGLVVVGCRTRRAVDWLLGRQSLAVRLAQSVPADVLIVPHTPQPTAWLPLRLGRVLA